MEFVIPGLILVAVMVYVSTRIKRSAAEAYQAETVETELFLIRKPDGFVAIASPAAPLLFEAYTRDYGTGEHENDRLISATVTRSPGGDPTEVISEWHIGEDRVVEGREGGFWVTRRTAGDLTLEIRSAEEPEGENARKIEEVLRSFELKAAGSRAVI
jgi:hypothetical protein